MKQHTAKRIQCGNNLKTGDAHYDYNYRGYRICKAIYTTGGGYYVKKISEDGSLGKGTHLTDTVRVAKSIIDTIIDNPKQAYMGEKD